MAVCREPCPSVIIVIITRPNRPCRCACRSVTRLATYTAGYKIFEITLSRGYGDTEFREDLMMKPEDARLMTKCIEYWKSVY